MRESGAETAIELPWRGTAQQSERGVPGRASSTVQSRDACLGRAFRREGLMSSVVNGNSAQYAESDIALACGSQKFIATLLFDLRCRLLLSLRSWIRKAFDCSPTNRERVMGLDRHETG